MSGLLRRLKGPGGLEAFYDETAVETKQAATSALKAMGVSEEQSPFLMLGVLDAVAQASSRGAVIEASSRIENRLLQLLREADVDIGETRDLARSLLSPSNEV